MKVCAWPNVADDNGSTIFNKHGLVWMTQLNVTVQVHLQGQMNPNLHHHFKFGFQPFPVHCCQIWPNMGWNHVGANHVSSEVHSVSWVKTYMTDDLFERNPLSQEFSSFLRRNMHSTLHLQILSWSRDSSRNVGEKKYVGQLRNKEIEQLVGTQRMVINAIKKIHMNIFSGLDQHPI